MKPLIVLLCVGAVTACAGDGTGLDEFGNPIGADGGGGAGASLTADVQPILSENCALAGCHAGTSPAQQQNLSAGQTAMNVVNVPALELSTMMRVRPGQPDSSYLVHKIQGTHASVGGQGGRMPLGQAALSATEIQVIRTWIAEGAADN
ncbi:MAG: hypothetical protein ACE5FJ_04060 [Gemmatimonadales bacterium]